MVNLSAIERINRLITEENINQMKRWSDRHRTTKSGADSIISKIRYILVLISGNDVIEMLKSLKNFLITKIIFF